MSSVATAGAAPSSRLSTLALALLGVAGWFVAALWVDELFLVVALVGVVAVLVGAKARRAAKRAGGGGAIADAAMIVGGAARRPGDRVLRGVRDLEARLTTVRATSGGAA